MIKLSPEELELIVNVLSDHAHALRDQHYEDFDGSLPESVVNESNAIFELSNELKTGARTLGQDELNTIAAALKYYKKCGQGDPFNRSDETHELATAHDQISLNEEGIETLIQRIL